MRSDARSSATTTRGARTTSSPGTTGTPRTPRCASSRAGLSGFAASTRSSGARPSCAGSSRWAQDDAPRLAGRRLCARHVPERQGDRSTRRARRRRGGRLLPVAVQRLRRGAAVPAPQAQIRRAMGARALDRRAVRRPRRRGLRRPHRGAGHLAIDRPPEADRLSSPSVDRGAVELRATYRLQLSNDCGFPAAPSLIPSLRDLGISHIYVSPSFQARPGSTHGYDVIDPRRLSDALGGREEFELLAAAARQNEMGIVLDIVPNHMAVSEENRYWADPELRGRFFDIDPVSGRHRRFFDIDDLAGVRQEQLDVFEETHELAISLLRGGLVDGLRVDHPDGLANPAEYLTRLRARGAGRVWVEKILDPSEHLGDWPVCGTVGYEFLNDVCALFVDPVGERPLTELWTRVSGDDRGFGDVAQEAKLQQVRGTFGPEVERLARLAPSLDPDVLSRG